MPDHAADMMAVVIVPGLRRQKEHRFFRRQQPQRRFQRQACLHNLLRGLEAAVIHPPELHQVFLRVPQRPSRPAIRLMTRLADRSHGGGFFSVKVLE